MQAARSAHGAGQRTPTSDNARRQPGVVEDHEYERDEFTPRTNARARRRYLKLARSAYACPITWANELESVRRYAEALVNVPGRAARQARSELIAFEPLARAGVAAALERAFPGATLPPEGVSVEALSALIGRLCWERS